MILISGKNLIWLSLSSEYYFASKVFFFLFGKKCNYICDFFGTMENMVQRDYIFKVFDTDFFNI
jgi:hypothetical protein